MDRQRAKNPEAIKALDGQDTIYTKNKIELQPIYWFIVIFMGNHKNQFMFIRLMINKRINNHRSSQLALLESWAYCCCIQIFAIHGNMEWSDIYIAKLNAIFALVNANWK